MRWNVERLMPLGEIQQKGKDATRDHARLCAWLDAVRDARPTRSLALLSEEENERHGALFLLVRFAVDE